MRRDPRRHGGGGLLVTRARVALLLLAVASCGKGGPAATGFAPITGTVQLTLAADPDLGPSFWAILRRDGAEEFKVQKVPAGVRTAFAWREEVTQPRDWRLKFGPSRHPTYQLILVRDGARPDIRVQDLDLWRDPARSLAIAYFAVPFDGEKELKLSLAKPAPLDVSVCDSAGAPLEGVPVLAIKTPRYFFF